MTDPIRKRAEDIVLEWQLNHSVTSTPTPNIGTGDSKPLVDRIESALREQVELDAKIAEKHDCCVIEICDKSYAPSDYCDEAIADAIREQGGSK